MEFELPSDAEQWPPRDMDKDIWPKAWQALFLATKEKLLTLFQFQDRVAEINALSDDNLGLQLIHANKGDGPLELVHGLIIQTPGKEEDDILRVPHADSEHILNNLLPQFRVELARDVIWYYLMYTMKHEDNVECEVVVEVEYEEEEGQGANEGDEEKEEGDEEEGIEQEESQSVDDDVEFAIPELIAYKANGGDVVDKDADGTDTEITIEDEEREKEEAFVHASDDELLNEISEFGPGELDKDALENPEEDPDYIEMANRDPALRAMYVMLVNGEFHYPQ